MKRSLVLDAVDEELCYQIEKWGDDRLHDDPEAYLVFMQTHLTEAMVLCTQGNKEAAQHAVRKITALGVACMEQHGAPCREGS